MSPQPRDDRSVTSATINFLMSTERLAMEMARALPENQNYVTIMTTNIGKFVLFIDLHGYLLHAQ